MGTLALLAQRVHRRKQNEGSSQRKVGQDFKGLQAEVMDQWGAIVCSGVRVSEKSQVWDSLSGLEIKGEVQTSEEAAMVTSCMVPTPISLPSPALLT